MGLKLLILLIKHSNVHWAFVENIREIMRDLGLLGELSFQSWCAQEGLIANGAKIDKTGWDFFIEFPMSQELSSSVLHKSAINCKIQVKATDKQDRKLPITISNLRQMATAQMPAFYIFLEFDGKNEVQRAFILHVNNEIIYSTLKRIHEIEQSDEENNLNKRKMTLKYNEKNQLKSLDGKSLKENLLEHIGKDYSKYIEEKNNFLENCGFENGYGKVNFSINGKEGGLPKLIDLSLGLIDELDVENYISIDERFGISSKTPNFELDNAKLKIDLLPPKKGKITFREDIW